MNQGLRQKKIFFCINPRAGGGKAMAWWQQALPLLERQGLVVFWQYSAGGEKTSSQVRQAVLDSGATLVVAIGGDGHLHDVLNGLLENEELITPELALALYPAGSGCDFARMVYQNKGDTTVNGLLELLYHGEICRVDVGRAAFIRAASQPGSKYFLNACDIGLGAQTCVNVNARGGLLKAMVRDGKLAFLLGLLQALRHYDYPRVSVEADGERFEGRYLIAAAGNGRYMGGNMCLFPKAYLDDGQLDLLLIPALSRFRVLTLMHKLYGGAILGVPGIVYRQVRNLIITPEQPLALELDGELPGQAPLSVKVLPGLLPLLCFTRQPS